MAAPSTSTTTLAIKALSITISLVASGGIASPTLFDIPELQSQPASRSLPQLRWLFSRGSHIFPTACLLSSAGFVYTAFQSLPLARRYVAQLLLHAASNTTGTNGFLLAAALSFTIAPFTRFVMLPTNFEIIRFNAEEGGVRSARAAAEQQQSNSDAAAATGAKGCGERPIDDLLSESHSTANQITDLSGPQSKTRDDSTAREDERARELLGKFGRMNMGRAVLIGAGGVVGLCTALMP
ncbi:hypothetical protein AAFC00_003371 [Neodothiora populina]|uniref:Uncharacterized protein n=1 Tax=Neodothiora populina TaxID=2781224 RepID=A0ABR3PDZ7_9PEZI